MKLGPNLKPNTLFAVDSGFTFQQPEKIQKKKKKKNLIILRILKKELYRKKTHWMRLLECTLEINL